MIIQSAREIKIAVSNIPALKLAADDLAADFNSVLAAKVTFTDRPDDAMINVSITADEGKYPPETFLWQTDDRKIFIESGDLRGAIYGMYHLSHEYLKVDPMGFWTGKKPLKLDKIEIHPGQLRSDPPAFRLRGWFINDEDLLDCLPCREHGPYIDIGLYREIFRTMLRLGFNFVIPSTLLDALDEHEAAVLHLAGQFGLMTGFHHIEPLGVMPAYQYRRFCHSKGVDAKFSFTRNSERVTECWEAYARKLAEIGNQIWTLGYRGETDCPFWNSETDAPKTTKERGQIISKVLHKQWDIVQKYDHQAVGTVCLWDEGSLLYRENTLDIPPGTIVVFTDDGRTQTFQSDMKCLDEDLSSRDRKGAYYHLQFSTTGPLITQGNPPEKIANNLQLAIRKNCTDYFLLNVGTIREFTYGLRQVAGILATGKAGEVEAFKNDFFRFYFPSCASQASSLYGRYFDSFINLDPGSPVPFHRLFLDGCHKALQEGLFAMLQGRDIGQERYLEIFKWLHVRMSLLNVSEECIHDRDEHSNPNIWRYPTLEGFIDFLASHLPVSLDNFSSLCEDIEHLAEKLPPEEGRLLLSEIAWPAAAMKGLTGVSLSLLSAVVKLRDEGPAQARKEISNAIGFLKDTIAKRAWVQEGPLSAWFSGEEKYSLPHLLITLRKTRSKL